MLIEDPEMSSVCPSGWALPTSLAAMMPLAPGRLSTTICCARRSDNFSATSRPTRSVAPPGVNPTIEPNRTLRIAFRSRRGRVHGGRAECDRREQTTDRGFRNHYSSPGVLTKSR